MDLRPIIETVDGVTTVSNLLGEIELDPATLGNVNVFSVHVTIADASGGVKYEVVGYNAGSGYLRCRRAGES